MKFVKKTFPISALSLLILFISSCSNTNCKNTMCTTLFAMVDISISDTTNTNLTGISTETALLSTGEIIHTQAIAGSFPVNSFTVVDDSDLKGLGFNTAQKVELRIIKNSKVLKSISFTIKTDCCHISKTDGPTDVSLN